MKVTISPKLLALVFASSLSHEATFSTIDFPGATSTVAFDINPSGEIVGRYVTAGNTHGFLLSTKGELTAIDFPGAVFTVAAGINPRGDIVGMYRLASDLQTVRHGFLLRGGEFTTIDPPRALFTNALGINPRGDIVGRYCTTVTVPCTPNSENVHGFLLSEGTFTTIDFPAAIVTNAWKINPSGQIVGGYTAADGENHLFRLSDGHFSTIDSHGGIALSVDNGGINPRGDIVGIYCDTAPCAGASTDQHGFLLSSGDFTAIDFPGALATNAFGVNAFRDIVGFYVDTSGRTHGFLLRSSDCLSAGSLSPFISNGPCQRFRSAP